MLHFVPTPIGNLEDMSLRSLNLLKNAKVILCEDTRVTKRLLHLLSKREDFIPKVEKYISLHSHNEESVLKQIDLSIFDDTVLYMSDAGMPSISDPGCKLVDFCRQNDIDFDILPGANALLLAYASSGFCDTQFLFWGFLPHKGKQREESLKKALYSGFVTIIYEAPHRIEKLVSQIASLEPEREIFLIKEATKLHQKRFWAKSSQMEQIIKNENQKGEWVVVVNADKKELGIVTVDDILKLELPKKQMAKMVAKITGKSAKECYKELI